VGRGVAVGALLGSDGGKLRQLPGNDFAALRALEGNRKSHGLVPRRRGWKAQWNRFVNVYLNDEDIRFLKNLDTPVKEGDEISIVPAIAGGTD
jgi:molybdopterin converting factor small subunit